MSEKHITGGLLAAVAMMAMAATNLALGTARAEESTPKAAASADAEPKHSAGDRRSGYLYAAAETQAMIDDDFANPGMIWVDKGTKLWAEPQGTAGKACASCHADPKKDMAAAGRTYPKYSPAQGKVITLEQRINLCVTENLKAPALAYESEPLLALETFIRFQARGLPIEVATDGAAAPVWEKGRELYTTRMGQLNLACASCHDNNAGKMIRGDLLSQGQSNGYPTYRLPGQTISSIGRRFQVCNAQLRAQPFPLGSDEYVALELYVASRGEGLAVEAPSIRK